MRGVIALRAGPPTSHLLPSADKTLSSHLLCNDLPGSEGAGKGGPVLDFVLFRRGLAHSDTATRSIPSSGALQMLFPSSLPRSFR